MRPGGRRAVRRLGARSRARLTAPRARLMATKPKPVRKATSATRLTSCSGEVRCSHAVENNCDAINASSSKAHPIFACSQHHSRFANDHMYSTLHSSVLRGNRAGLDVVCASVVAWSPEAPASASPASAAGAAAIGVDDGTLREVVAAVVVLFAGGRPRLVVVRGAIGVDEVRADSVQPTDMCSQHHSRSSSSQVPFRTA
mmetsp:Transcript_110757/g.307952  ORF Transcript_110757/g.307952 Transcript_110757/m.307952 type:complete len:200 (-) Transcript_110757:276-875(-)